MIRTTFALVALFCLAHSLHAAGPATDAFTDAKSAGADYALQGEYRGKSQTQDGEQKMGAQVIALGDGKFRVVGFYGGLPGAGWSRGDKSVTFEAEAKDGVLTSNVDDAEIKVTAKEVTVTHDGTVIGQLKKTNRVSPTIGTKPPAGAIVLFDGSTAEKFNSGKIVEDKLLGATNVESKDKFGDHTLHIEFRTPFMPKARGQGRGNSGVYVQSRYEVQVLDSFGLDGADNECGGIYQIAKPAVNMCLPPLVWQTYDIDFTAARYDDAGKKTKNARVTIKHNGVVIHDDLELPRHTPGRHAESAEPDSLFMQDHGNPIAFRNIWVVKK